MRNVMEVNKSETGKASTIDRIPVGEKFPILEVRESLGMWIAVEGEIKKVIGEPRKKVIPGNASDTVLG